MDEMKTLTIGNKIFETVDATARSDIAAAEADLAVQTARIDEIASLPEGSTSGDAELSDIRVGYDGFTYPNAGDAVRGQVGRIGRDLQNITGTVIGTFLQKKYVDLSGNTADVDNPLDTPYVECCIIGCTAGDIFEVSGYGQNLTRQWGFVDIEGNILSKADANTEADRLLITAPKDAVTLVVHNTYSHHMTPEVLKNPLYLNIKELNDVGLYYKQLYGGEVLVTDDKYVNATDGVIHDAPSSNIWKLSMYLDVEGLDFVDILMPIIYGSTNTTHNGIAFYDKDKEFISGVEFNVLLQIGLLEERRIDVPANAKYLLVPVRKTDINSFYVRAYISNGWLYLHSKQVESSMSFGMQLFEKIGVIGDSISVGWAKDKNGNNSRRNTGISWVQQMARRLGCTAYNLGASGVDPVEWFQPNYEFAQYCYTQYQSVGFCDLYIVGLGLNQATLGTIADINESDYTQNADTFYGQYARIVQMINAEHPNSIVICLTEPTTRITSYDQAVRDICALPYINAQLVDLENDYLEMFNTPEILAEHQPDGMHFTPYGYSLIAEAMVKALNDYISNHTTAFKYVGVSTV